MTDTPTCECHDEPMFFKPRSDGGKGSWQCSVRRREATRRSKMKKRDQRAAQRRRGSAKSITVKHWPGEFNVGVCECGRALDAHVHHIGPIPWCDLCSDERR